MTQDTNKVIKLRGFGELANVVKPKEPEYIDVTPTWRGILPLLLAGYEAGTAEGRRQALIELYRMADIADRAVAASKGPTPVDPSENIGSLSND